LIQISKTTEWSKDGFADADQAALGTMVKFGRRKRQIIKVIEALMKPFVTLLDGLRGSTLQESQEVQKILVVEYWNLGDIVMQSPFLINLRIRYPQAHIVLLTSPKVVPLISDQGLVDEIIEVRVPWAQHYSRWRKYNPFSSLWIEMLKVLIVLRGKHFDLAFAARADLRDNFILWLTEARRRVGYAFGGGGLFLTDKVVPDVRNPHFANRWLRLLEHLGDPVIERQPRLRIAEEDQQAAWKLLQERGVRPGDFLVGIHPGARSVNRQWGVENFSQVAERVLAKYPVKLLWFQEPGQEARAPESDQVVPLALGLRQFMAVLAECGALICNDSGPMHIATALNVPVVAVFGPTEPLWFGPIGADNRIVIQSGFWCRPCFDYCIFDAPYCLKTVTVRDVFESADQTLGKLLSEPAEDMRPVVVKKVSRTRHL
jgi:lipopolysaccharide heptosyltransferase II